MSEFAISQARDHLSDLINRITYLGERIVLTRHGRGVAALVPIEVLRDLEAAENAADLEAAHLAAAEPEPNVPHAEVLAELAEDDRLEP